MGIVEDFDLPEIQIESMEATEEPKNFADSTVDESEDY